MTWTVGTSLNFHLKQFIRWVETRAFSSPDKVNLAIAWCAASWRKRRTEENFAFLGERMQVEADSLWCLTALLDGIQDHYTFAQPGIQRLVFRFKELVRRIDGASSILLRL